jgi:hypothetical protein
VRKLRSVLLAAGFAIMTAGNTLGAEPAVARMVLVADSRRFSGWEAWWANVYNEGHLEFAVLTIAIIPALGLIMGKATDLVMARIGINLKSRVLREG